MGRIFILPASRRGTLPDRAGGGGVNRRGIDERLEKAGFEVVLFDVNDAPRNPLAGRAAMLKSIDPLRALAVMTARPGPAAIISYFESGVLLPVLLRRLFGLRAPIVIVDIGVGGRSRLRALLLRIVIPRVAAIVTLGSAQVDFIRRHYRTGAIVEFVPQQVDTDFYAPDPAAPEEDYILAVGDDHSRDYDTLLAAAAGLRARLVLKTRKVAEDKTRHPAMTVIRDRLSDGELKSLYARARLVVLPLHDTIHAGGVTALLEAMAMGKPVVVSDSTGLRDYTGSGDACRVVPVRDAGAMRAAIDELLADEALRARLGRAARLRAQTHHSQDAMAARLVALLHKLSGSGP